MKLVIAEKPSVAQAIAKVLKATNRKDGYIENNEYIISWCVGHLIQFSMPEVYGEKYAEKKWRVENLPILPDEWKFSISESTKKQYNILKSLINDKRVSELICATDSGREGELIFRLVYNQTGTTKPFKRLWISSMEESAILDGFKNLRDGVEYEKLYQSALCRAKADWLVGINATRLFSATYKSLLSVGRVQTPTLAMIVERDEKIKNFVKEKYFTVEIDCGFTASSERIAEQGKAETIKELCHGQNAIVKSVVKEQKTINPPKLYDLTTLQRECNRIFGYTAQETLNYTQALYEKKLVTYPRTDSQYLTEDMANTALSMIELIKNTLPFERIDFSINIQRILDNKKVSDHHAIIPTAEIAKQDINTLSQEERNVLFLVANKLLCATAEKHIFETVTAILNCKENDFTAKGKTILHNGWKDIENSFRNSIKGTSDKTETEDKSLPMLEENQIFENISADVLEHWTSPPKHYTEDTLLSAMEYAGNADYSEDSDVEKKGLGTPATRASIIENLAKREFIQRNKKLILATEKGINLIKIVPDTIKSAKLTADWESSLQKIEQGKYSDLEYITNIEKFVVNLVKDNSGVINQNVQNAFKKKDERDIIGKCPKCANNVYEGKGSFYCEKSYGENKSCTFFLNKSDKFFTSKKKTLTTTMAKSLLKHGKVQVKGMYSEKKDKKYDAFVILADTTGQYVKYGLEF